MLLASRTGSRWGILFPNALLLGLSKFSCPLCVGAYSSVLASVGGGVLATQAGLAGVTIALLLLNSTSMAWSARHHRHYSPLWFTLTGSAAIITERLVWTVPALLYIGVAVITAASLWNLIVARKPRQVLVPIHTSVHRSNQQEETYE